MLGTEWKRHITARPKLLSRLCEGNHKKPSVFPCAPASLLFLLTIAGIGTLAFDTRLGLYEDPPPQSALEFTNAVNNFFELAQQLLFNIFSRIARPYIDTPTFKKFLINADALFEIGQVFVDNKMRELNMMAEKGIDPSNAQGA